MSKTSVIGWRLISSAALTDTLDTTSWNDCFCGRAAVPFIGKTHVLALHSKTHLAERLMHLVI